MQMLKTKKTGWKEHNFKGKVKVCRCFDDKESISDIVRGFLLEENV